ncbi:unnamed protein product [Withania somnifera]
MGPRWKGKGAEVKALADPISEIVSQLQSSLISLNSRGLLSGTSVLLKADSELTDLLNRAGFGRPKVTSEKNEQWFQLSMEEAFYLQYSVKCVKIVDHNDTELNDEELWKHMTSRKENFPSLFKVMRPGSQYGVDFVAYRHHPALVHSEYAVLVLSAQDGSTNGRLTVWSDFHCTLRLCRSVAKTLLILDIEQQQSCATSPSCLDNYVVDERTITRWSPEQGREENVKSDPSVK